MEQGHDIQKSLELFKVFVHEFKEMLDNKKVSYDIRRNNFGIIFHERPQGELISQLPEELVQKIIQEIVELVLAILNRNENTILEQAARVGDEHIDLTRNKLALVKEYLVNEKLYANYYFLNNCTSNVIRGLTAQPIIKPGPQGFPDIVALNITIEVDNNYYPQPRIELVNFEINKNGLESLIRGLNDLLCIVKKQEESVYVNNKK